jgi:type IV conjugative transfer system coupling protein TraD
MSQIKVFTRGGQTLLHTLRMIEQVMQWLVGIFFASFFCCVCLIFIHNTTLEERSLLVHFAQANINYLLNKNSSTTLKIHGLKYTVKSDALIHSQTVKKEMHRQFILFKAALKKGFIFSLLSLICMIIGLYFRGKRIDKTRLLSGRYHTSPKAMIKKIKSIGEISDLHISGVPLFKNSEKLHILIHGSTGQGKSEAIRQLLDQIKARGDKAVIYDKHGSFMQYFYDKEKDILLNPLDERCASWNIWAECEDAADYDQIATALMPMPLNSGGDPFWINGSRTIFASVAYKMAQLNQKSTKKLLQYLLSSDLAEIENFVKGTEAETLVSDKIQKTALSIKSVLATYLKTLKYLKEDGEIFSIRQWIADDTQKNWLFITSNAAKHESLKPLISCWIDIAVNALMSCKEDPNRRVWFILDELPSLHRLPYLPEAFAEIRKFGGCLVPGLQSYFQLQKIYGQDGAKEIVDLCNTRLFFRAPSAAAAEWSSKELGQADIIESREGISYGANTVRDGVSISTQRLTRPAISASEIMNLPNFQAILSIPPSVSPQQAKNKKISKIVMEWPICTIVIDCKERIEKELSYFSKIKVFPVNTKNHIKNKCLLNNDGSNFSL